MQNFSSSSRLLQACQNGHNIEIEAAGRHWLLKRGASLDELWNQMNETDFEDERMPYWTELWPSSLLLAKWLYLRKDELGNKNCLDLGCGLGFTAIVAQYLGANALAGDYEIEALRHTRLNAKINNVKVPVCVLMDWRIPPFASKSFQYIWGADIVYEKRCFEPLRKLMLNALAVDGRAWLAEPGRTIFKDFTQLLNENDFMAEPELRENISGVKPVTAYSEVTIWQVRRKK